MMMSQRGLAQKDLPSLMHDNTGYTTDILQPPTNQIVLMIYNLCMDKFNCDRVFNLFCLYGNVDRVCFKLINKATHRKRIPENENSFL